MDIHFDTVNAIWEIWLDGEPAHSGPVNTDGRLWQIRLTGGGTGAEAADNFILHGGEPSSDVEDGDGDSAFAMGRTLPPHPNPATEGATIRWTTSGPATVRVEVSDIAGRRVWARTATAGAPSGVHSMRWDGRDAKGRALPSGCYFVRVFAKGRALGTEKIVLRR